MVTVFKIGDRVAYSRQWLRATGQLVGDVPLARARVIGLSPVSADLDVATVEWNRPGIPAKVLTSNLTRLDRLALERA